MKAMMKYKNNLKKIHKNQRAYDLFLITNNKLNVDIKWVKFQFLIAVVDIFNIVTLWFRP